MKIHLFPGESGTGYIFENKIVGGSIPNEFMKPVDEGIGEALTRGVLAGYPIEDVRVELYDGSYHDVDSSEMTFRVAGGDVISKLAARGGQIELQEERGGAQVILARAPLSEMFGYATELRFQTQGRATYSMHFDRYEPYRGGPDDDRSLSVGDRAGLRRT